MIPFETPSRPAGRDCRGQRVLDLESHATLEGQRHPGQQGPAVPRESPIGQDDRVVADEQPPCRPWARWSTILGVLGVAGEENDLPPAPLRHAPRPAGRPRSGRRGPPSRVDDVDDRLLDPRELLQGLDVREAEVVTLRRYWSPRPRRSGRTRAPRGESPPWHIRGRRPRRPGSCQDRPGTPRAAAIARLDQAAADVNSLGASHSRPSESGPLRGCGR